MERMKPTGTEKDVAEDIAARQALGLEKYGVSVRDNPLNKNQWLEHAYQESLDLPIYLKRAIEEDDKLKKATYLAGKLLAFIKVNHRRKAFDCSEEELEWHLQPFEDELDELIG